MDSKSDSPFLGLFPDAMGESDKRLSFTLANAGPDHGKFLRMIHVQTTITAPAYWVAEHDTYKVGTVRNSGSFMHTGVRNGFTLDGFDTGLGLVIDDPSCDKAVQQCWISVLKTLNGLRDIYLETKDEKYFRLIRKLLPSGWLIRYKWDANYQVLRTIYHQRKNHRLPEWHLFCKWIESLPCSWLITGDRHVITDEND